MGVLASLRRGLAAGNLQSESNVFEVFGITNEI